MGSTSTRVNILTKLDLLFVSKITRVQITKIHHSISNLNLQTLRILISVLITTKRDHTNTSYTWILRKSDITLLLFLIIFQLTMALIRQRRTLNHPFCCLNSWIMSKDFAKCISILKSRCTTLFTRGCQRIFYWVLIHSGERLYVISYKNNKIQCQKKHWIPDTNLVIIGCDVSTVQTFIIAIW